MTRSLRHSTALAVTMMLTLLLCIAAFAFPASSYAAAETTVTIGTGTGADSDLPYSNGWNYSKTQVIYPVEEIGMDGSIVSVAYNVATASPDYKVAEMKIWMGHTSVDLYDWDAADSVANSVYSLHEGDVTLVYSGAPKIGASTGWETIDLDTPFEYDREKGNLVIVTGVKVSGTGTNDLTYYWTTDVNGSVVKDKLTALVAGDQRDSSIAELTYSGTNYWKPKSARPNIQIGFGAPDDGTATVTFDADGGLPAPETQTVTKGETAEVPEEPSKDGHTFLGWFNGDDEFDFSAAITSSITLKAKWEKKKYTVKWLNYDGTELETDSDIEYGETPVYDGDEPVKDPGDGKTYKFTGWDPEISPVSGPQEYTAVFVDADSYVDKKALNDAIREAEAADDDVLISADGSDIDPDKIYVTAEVQQAFEEAIAAAKEAAADETIKQEQVDTATSELNSALDTYKKAQKPGKKGLPRITKISIDKTSGRRQPAIGGVYAWHITFDGPVDKITDDHFTIQRKPYGDDWRNSKCPVPSFDKETSTLSALAIPDNTSAGFNQWRFVYAGDSDVECEIIVQRGAEQPEPADKTALNDAIQAAEDAKKNVKVSADGADVDKTAVYVTADEQKSLDDALAAAMSVADDVAATQEQVDAAAVDLEVAIENYNKAKKNGTKTPASEQMGKDGTPVGEGASAEAADAAITKSKSEEGPAGTVFGKLQLRSTKQTKSAITLKWTKVKGAAKYVVYANAAGKSNAFKKVTTSTGSSFKLTKAGGKKLVKAKYYKAMVVALDKSGNVVTTSKAVHVATKGGKAGNATKITTAAKKNKVSVKKSKSFKLRAKQKAAKGTKIKNYRKLSYESSNNKIATVSKKGVIKGKAKGSCVVYVYAQNGVFAKIKVTVK